MKRKGVYVPQVHLVGGAVHDKPENDLCEGRVLVVVTALAAAAGFRLPPAIALALVPGRALSFCKLERISSLHM